MQVIDFQFARAWEAGPNEERIGHREVEIRTLATGKRPGSTAIAKRLGVDLTELREAAESKLDEIAETCEEMNQHRSKLRTLKKDGQPYQDALTELGVISEVLRAKADSACAMIDEIIEALPDCVQGRSGYLPSWGASARGKCKCAD